MDALDPGLAAFAHLDREIGNVADQVGQALIPIVACIETRPISRQLPYAAQRRKAMFVALDGVISVDQQFDDFLIDRFGLRFRLGRGF